MTGSRAHMTQHLCPSVPCTCFAMLLLPWLASFSGHRLRWPWLLWAGTSLQGSPGDHWSLHGISHRLSALNLTSLAQVPISELVAMAGAGSLPISGSAGTTIACSFLFGVSHAFSLGASVLISKACLSWWENAAAAEYREIVATPSWFTAITQRDV